MIPLREQGLRKGKEGQQEEGFRSKSLVFLSCVLTPVPTIEHIMLAEWNASRGESVDGVTISSNSAEVILAFSWDAIIHERWSPFLSWLVSRFPQVWVGWGWGHVWGVFEGVGVT